MDNLAPATRQGRKKEQGTMVRLGPNGIGGAAIVGIAIFFAWWTFHTDLPFDAALIPRIAITAIVIGGAWILIKDIFGRSTLKINGSWGEALMGLAVLVTVSLYGWVMLRLGLTVSAFLFLLGWTLVLRWRMKDTSPMMYKTAFIVSVCLAASAFCYFLFILLLDLYMPNTILF